MNDTSHSDLYPLPRAPQSLQKGLRCGQLSWFGSAWAAHYRLFRQPYFQWIVFGNNSSRGVVWELVGDVIVDFYPSGKFWYVDQTASGWWWRWVFGYVYRIEAVNLDGVVSPPLLIFPSFWNLWGKMCT